MLVRIAIVVLLIEMYMQVRTLAKQLVQSGVGHVAAVDVKRFELFDLRQLSQSFARNWHIDQVKPFDGWQFGESFHAGVCNMRISEAQLFEVGQLLETFQGRIGKDRLWNIKDAEVLEFRDLSEGLIVDLATAEAQMLEVLQRLKVLKAVR